MAALPIVLVLFASLAAGQDAPAQNQLDATTSLSQAAATTPDSSQAKDAAGTPFNGGTPNGNTVSDDGTIKKGIPLSPSTTATPPNKKDVPSPPPGKEETSKIPTGLMLAGATALGGLQGWFAAGLAGAAGGAAVALGAAWLFHEGDYGAAFGMTAGAIVGAVFGGPLGAIAGAVVGGLAGHFIGKLFL